MKKKTYAEKIMSLKRKVANAMQGEQAVGIYYTKFYRSKQFNIIVDEGVDEENNEIAKCIRFLNVEKIVKNDDGKFVKTWTPWYAAFDMTAIEPHSEITLKVPKEKEGLFAGKGLWQLKKWCKMLDVKCIHVVGV